MDASQPTFFLSPLGARPGRVRRSRRASAGSPPTPPGCSASPTAACCARARSPTSTCIDLDGLALELPEYVHDFPGGAGRYVQQAHGLPGHASSTAASSLEDGHHTGDLAGVVLRSGE